MAWADGSTEAVVMEVVARARPSDAPRSRLGRIRCVHCAMPSRGSTDRCWSCGLDPTAEEGTAAAVAAGPLSHGAVQTAPRPGRRPLLVGAGLVLILALVLGAIVLLPPADGGHGVRGLSARLRGTAWERAQVPGASAAFPSAPIRRTLQDGPGRPGTTEDLVATDAGLRTELMATELADATDARAAAEGLVTWFAASSTSRVVERVPVAVRGGSGLDAVLQGSAGPIRIRAHVAGTSGYLLAVSGPAEAFRRFTDSFEASAPRR